MPPELQPSDFSRLRDLLEQNYGLKMPPQKKLLLESRLSRRMQALNLPSIDAYCEFLFSAEGVASEEMHMVDVVTTNKTDFFREPEAFQFLAFTGLPALLAARSEVAPVLRVWSSACSTGEEPYTLAMTLEEYRRQRSERPFQYVVLATDISTRVLDAARAGIYTAAKVQPIPTDLKRRYLLRSRDESQELVRIVPALRKRIRFERLNLMDALEIHPLLDVIFCRNVIIYFDRNTQIRLLERMCSLLVPGGYLMMGHSETLNGMSLPLQPVGPMIYQRTP